VTTLPTEGFLAGEVEAVVATMRARYGSWLAEIRGLNRLLVQAQYELRVHPESAQELTCATLYMRSLVHCQAALLLLERGMLASAHAVIRCALEGLFNLGACSRDYRVALSFLDADQVDRRRRARYLGQVQDGAARAILTDAELRAIIAEADQRIEELGARELRARDMAKQAELEDLYLTAYASLSGAVHSSAGDLEQHVQADDAGKVAALVSEPVLDRLEVPLMIIAETMICMVRAMARVFQLSISDACETHLQALHDLGNERAG
jgi:hypothetical protein